MVIQGGGDDIQLQTAWDKIGAYYSERSKWSKAVQYYKQSKNLHMLAECYYRLEHYDALRALVDTVPDGTESELLATIGSRFTAVGLAVDAVAAYIKAGNVKAAIDAAVLVNAWDCAVELAERYEFPQLEGLLAKYAARLLAQGERLQAVELYRKANKVNIAN
jgi:WD repeat-containing protein 35